MPIAPPRQRLVYRPRPSRYRQSAFGQRLAAIQANPMAFRMNERRMNELSNILADTNSNFGDDDEPDPLPDIEDVDEPQEEEEYDPLEHVFPPSLFPYTLEEEEEEDDSKELEDEDDDHNEQFDDETPTEQQEQDGASESSDQPPAAFAPPNETSRPNESTEQGVAASLASTGSEADTAIVQRNETARPNDWTMIPPIDKAEDSAIKSAKRPSTDDDSSFQKRPITSATRSSSNGSQDFSPRSQDQPLLQDQSLLSNGSQEGSPQLRNPPQLRQRPLPLPNQLNPPQMDDLEHATTLSTTNLSAPSGENLGPSAVNEEIMDPSADNLGGSAVNEDIVGPPAANEEDFFPPIAVKEDYNPPPTAEDEGIADNEGIVGPPPAAEDEDLGGSAANDSANDSANEEDTNDQHPGYWGSQGSGLPSQPVPFSQSPEKDARPPNYTKRKQKHNVDTQGSQDEDDKRLLYTEGEALQLCFEELGLSAEEAKDLFNNGFPLEDGRRPVKLATGNASFTTCYCPGCTKCLGEAYRCTVKMGGFHHMICGGCMDSLRKEENNDLIEAIQRLDRCRSKLMSLGGNGSSEVGILRANARAQYEDNQDLPSLKWCCETQLNYLCSFCQQWTNLCQKLAKTNMAMIEKALEEIAQRCPMQFLFALGVWFTDGTIVQESTNPCLSLSQCGYNARIIGSFLVSLEECTKVFSELPEFTKVFSEVPIKGNGTVALKVSVPVMGKRKTVTLLHVPLYGEVEASVANRNAEALEEFGLALFQCSHDAIWTESAEEREADDDRLGKVKATVKNYLEGTAYWDDFKRVFGAKSGALWNSLGESEIEAPLQCVVTVQVESWLLILFEYFMLGHSKSPACPNVKAMRVFQERILLCHRMDTNVLISSIQLFILGAVAGDGAIGPYPWKQWVEGKTFFTRGYWALALDESHSKYFQRLAFRSLGMICAIRPSCLTKDGLTQPPMLISRGGLLAVAHTCKLFKEALDRLISKAPNKYDSIVIPKLKRQSMLHFSGCTKNHIPNWGDSFPEVDPEWWGVCEKIGWGSGTKKSFNPPPLEDNFSWLKKRLEQRYYRPHDFPPFTEAEPASKERNPYIVLRARKELADAIADLWKAFGHFPGISPEEKARKCNRFRRVLFNTISEGRIDFAIRLRDLYRSYFREYPKTTTVFKHEKLGQQLKNFRRKHKGNYPKRHDEFKPYFSHLSDD